VEEDESQNLNKRSEVLRRKRKREQERVKVLEKELKRQIE
jgi:hypothetical protein